MKKFMSVLLSVTMLFCFSAPFFAESKAEDYKEIAEKRILEILEGCPQFIEKDVEDISSLRAVAYPNFPLKGEAKAYKDLDINHSNSDNGERYSMRCIVYDGDEAVYENVLVFKGESSYLAGTQKFLPSASDDTYRIAEGIKLLKEKFEVKDEDIVIFSNNEGVYASIDESGKSLYRVGVGYFGCFDVPLADKKYSYSELCRASDAMNDYMESGKDERTNYMGAVPRYYIDDFIKLPMTLWIHIAVGALLVLCAVVIIIRVKRNKKR